MIRFFFPHAFLLFSTLLNAQTTLDCPVRVSRQRPGPAISIAVSLHEQWLQRSPERAARADFRNQDLRNLWLVGTDLREAMLAGANLAGADLSRANLSSAEFYNSNLTCASLGASNLENAYLFQADLTNADLTSASLNKADLSWAILRNAILKGTYLADANLYHADITGAIFEPASLPDIRLIADATGFSSLRFHQPTALIQLRTSFKTNGFSRQERELTYALNRVERIDSAENLLRYLLFEITCNWGMSPVRPLNIAIYLILLHWAIYSLFIAFNRTTSKGIYRLRFSHQQPEHLHRENSNPLLSGLAFSLVSAAGQQGKLRVASLNPRGYTLFGKGSISSISAVQTIISFYLYSLFLITYFDNPFN